MLKVLQISKIKIGNRHRKDMGDLTSLAESIRQDGLLQPIGVTEKLELVFGERRLRAHQEILKSKSILARIVDVQSILYGEYAENEIRKDFTPSERVAIAKAIEKQVGNRRGQRTDRLVGKIPQVAAGKKTREVAAEKAGFGNDKTYRQAAKVVENGTSKLIHAMDAGRVSISAASILADADAEELEAILELDERAILKAAKEIRQQKTATRNREQVDAEAKAKKRINGKKTWTITSVQNVTPCRLVLADPPYGITNEPWEPKDLDGYTRQWCQKWTASGADFFAIFWSQENLWRGRTWFDESLNGYQFQELLIWHVSNAWSKKSRQTFKESWEPIFIYRRIGCTRQVLPVGRAWGDGLHNLDCCVSPTPQTVYKGTNLKQHPCQKPVAVMRWLIHALSDPGDMVASPFCGVAPCGIAASQLGRYYHGIEIDSHYRKLAERRILAYGGDAPSMDRIDYSSE
ncbi:DNA methyltransferase [Planctomicrobium sp. SH527]|uniref:DNA methyltransferase n=1 Tax=Planctomicrobium sp. SH527 TaxID=3448123 RepID=UPI003F5B7420